MYPLHAIPTPLPLIPFPTEEITVCTNEVPKVAKKAPRNVSVYFSFISCITVIVHKNLLMISWFY